MHSPHPYYAPSPKSCNNPRTMPTRGIARCVFVAFNHALETESLLPNQWASSCLGGNKTTSRMVLRTSSTNVHNQGLGKQQRSAGRHAQPVPVKFRGKGPCGKKERAGRCENEFGEYGRAIFAALGCMGSDSTSIVRYQPSSLRTQQPEHAMRANRANNV